MSLERIPIAAIQRTVAEHYDVSVAALIAPDGMGRRDAKIVKPRHIAMYLVRMLVSFPGRKAIDRFPIPYAQVGRAFGHRDHSSVIYAIASVDEMLREDEEVREKVRSILNALQESAGQPLLLEAA